MRDVRRYGFVTMVLVVFVSMLALMPIASAQEDEPAVHFVVDTSGSMAGQKLTEAIRAIKTVVSEIPNGTAVGFRSYAGGCDQSSVAPQVPIALDNDTAVLAAADGLRASGSTPTVPALDRGINELIAFGARGPNRIVLLTDGEPSCFPSVCDFVRGKDLRGAKIELFTVGLQVSKIAAEDLTCAARDLGGGEYFPASSPSELAEAVAKAATVPTTTTSTTTAPPDVEQESNTDDDADSKPPGGDAELSAADFTSHLFPRNEVPPLGGPGHGWSTWTVSDDGESISYRLVHGGLGNITATHLHQGGRSRNGPVVVPLDISNNDGRVISGSFTASDFAGPMNGRLMAGLVGAIETGNIYVNVHTSDHPAGAIRGQLTASQAADLDVITVGAPVEPSGRTPGARTDLIVGFADFDPDVPGISLKKGGTIKVTLPPEFVDRTNRPTVGSGALPGCAPPLILGCNTAVIHQGWPQSPVPPFPAVEHDAATNTFTLTAAADWPAGGRSRPGAKAVHLLALGFRNPAEPNNYPITVEIQPDPNSSRMLRGSGTVTIGYTRPVAAPNSLRAGAPPPPLPNTVHQQMIAGTRSLPMTFYLWDRHTRPIVGARIQMTNANLATIFNASNQQIGTITIDAPASATQHTILSPGPSAAVRAFATGLDVGQLEATFYAPPNARGNYKLIVALDGAEPLTHRISVSTR